jgi:hypothetical protein
VNPPRLLTTGKKWTIFHVAALAGLAAPLIGLVVTMILGSLRQGQSAGQPAILVLVGALAGLMLLLGLVCSVVALCGIPSQGRKRLLGYGLSGAVINVLLLSLFITGFVHGFREAVANKKASQQLTSATDAAVTNIANAYDPNSGINPDVQLKGLSEYRAQVDSASKRMSGDDGQAAQAMAVCMAKWERAQKDFAESMKDFDAPAVIDFKTLYAKGQLEQRRQAVQNYLKANETLRVAFSREESDLEAELRSRQMPAGTRNEILTGFRKSRTAVLAKVMEIRDCEANFCQALLKLLDLADSQWGRWRYDAAQGKVLFNETASAETFNQLHKQIEGLSKKEVQLQGEVVKIQTQMVGAQRR